MRRIASSLQLSLGLAAVLLVPTAPRAQCLDWDRSLGLPAGADGTVYSLLSTDLGNGPVLCAGGDFINTGNVATNRIGTWDGELWFPVGGGIPGVFNSYEIRALAMFDDGSGSKLHVAGNISTIGGVQAFNIARWDGSTWSALGSGLNGGAFALAVFDDGTGPGLYVAGNFTLAGGTPANGVARWNGSSWSALGSGTSSSVSALAAFDDGSGPALYVGGWFNQIGGVLAPHIARWNGTSWSAVGNGLDDAVLALLVHDDGTGAALHAGGRFEASAGTPMRGIARWNGTSWATVGGGLGTGGRVESMTVHDDGSGPQLCVGGVFASAGGTTAAHVARWDGASWSALGSGIAAFGPVSALASFDEGAGARLFAGGTFQSAGGVLASRIARWDGSAWSALGAPGADGGLDYRVHAMAVHDPGSGSELHVAANFNQVGATPHYLVARRHAGGWTQVGVSMSQTIDALATIDVGSGAELYAAGRFQFPAGRIARWNGTTWTDVGGGVNGAVGEIHALAQYDDGTGPGLYVGGLIDAIGPAFLHVHSIARWDGAAWSELAGGVDGAVDALAVFDDGSGPALYVGGSFDNAGTTPASRIAKWDGTSWSQLGSGTNDHVLALAVFDDGSGGALYAAGAFTQAGGQPANRIAKWDGTAWTPLSSGMDGLVFSLASFDDGHGRALYAGGEFTTAGGAPASSLARWNGSSWTSLGSGLNGGVRALKVFDDDSAGGADLFVGGSFTQAAAIPSARLARWRVCDESIEAMCFGDGSVAPCPCGNAGAEGRGCANSATSDGAVLAATGTTSPDTVVLAASGEPATALSIFLQGDALIHATVSFGDGLRCAGGNLKQLWAKNASGGAVSAPAPGDASITSQSAALGDTIPPGSTRFYQTYYRDPSGAWCPPQTFNVTNGVRIRW